MRVATYGITSIYVLTFFETSFVSITKQKLRILHPQSEHNGKWECMVSDTVRPPLAAVVAWHLRAMLLIKVCLSVWSIQPHSSVSTLPNSSFVRVGFSISQILRPNWYQRCSLGLKLGENADHGNTNTFSTWSCSPRSGVRRSAVECSHPGYFENRGVARRTEQRASRGHSEI